MTPLIAILFLLLLPDADFFVIRTFPISYVRNSLIGREKTSIGISGKSQISLEEFSRLGKRLTDVGIQSPSLNTRKITASIIIDSSAENIWNILTDYNNLATHVPNLVRSYLVPNQSQKLVLFQEGAQKIIGFDFRASLTMEMKEFRATPNVINTDSYNEWTLLFNLIDSRMFDAFDGKWVMRPYGRTSYVDPLSKQVIYKPRTKLIYDVFVRPRGPVPVLALEWRIREDIPVNLYAVKIAAEKVQSRVGNSSEMISPKL